MAIHLTPEANPTVQEGTLYVDSATGEFNVAGRTTPHIIPGVLYPAVSGNDINGTALGGSYVYGTAHTDGRKYYYTDIKGSKPIKDPRIGGHFGSQRHETTSLQLLEQETATHGSNVYSVDGREWIKAVGNNWSVPNSSSGYRIEPTSNSGVANTFVEITGYFNDIILGINGKTTDTDQYTISLNGGTVQANDANASVGDPKSGRYVASVSQFKPSFNSTPTLGINTVKIYSPSGFYCALRNIELIAQDTSNRNNIQVPSQNVVSYGKKFTVSAEGSSGHHYDPFNGFTSGSSVSSYVDTATSLGVENWKHSSTYYRPYNGGRVVKWVDSSGVIKTSVTLMPPNAQNIDGTDLSPKADASVANNTYLPTFSGAIDPSLSEVAKTFHFREFGNGSANGNPSYPDASTLTTTIKDVAYVMDDGLTSMSHNDAFVQVTANYGVGMYTENTGERYITFIGTGISVNMRHTGAGNASDDHRVYIDGVDIKEWDSTSNNTTNHWVTYAQNLPYGTHILKIDRLAAVSSVVVDNEYTFHQPKKPPIPEDACVIADYMLMADFVADTVGDTEKISKGTRIVSPSRDFFYDEDANTGFNNITIDPNSAFGLTLPDTGTMTSGSISAQLPYFGKEVIWRTLASRFGTFTEYVNNTSVTTTSISTNSNYNAKQKITGQSLGLNGIKTVKSSDRFLFAGLEVATPIHTSSHYQSFETPFLHELVGGDRNMEQTNLVVSPDGKTWDQLTRDTSYFGGMRLEAQTPDSFNGFSKIVFTDWRGALANNAKRSMFNKDFAIAYDRVICLVDGEYEINITTASDSTGAYLIIYVNGIETMTTRINTASESKSAGLTVQLRRGDYVQPAGEWGSTGANREYDRFSIKRIS